MPDSSPRKARPYELQAHEDEIRRHIIADGWTLKQIQACFADEYGLYATENMWKKLFKKLGLRLKKNRLEVMQAAAQHYQTCLDANIPFLYVVPQHKPINAEELWRYARRGGWTIVDGELRKALNEGPTLTIKHSDDGAAHDPVADLCQSNSMDTAEDSPFAQEPNSEPFLDPGLEKPSGNRIDHYEVGHIGRLSGPVIVSPMAGVAHAFATPDCYTRPGISSMSVYSPTENLFWALKLATTSSLDSGRARNTEAGYRLLEISRSVASRRSREADYHFRCATIASRTGKMHKAWRSYRAGLSCLFVALEMSFQQAMVTLLRIYRRLYEAKQKHMIKIIAWHTSQWCRQSSQPLEVTEIFTSICKIEETHVLQTLVGAKRIIGAEIRSRTSEFNPEVFSLWIDALRAEMLLDPMLGIECMLRELEVLKTKAHAPRALQMRLSAEICCAYAQLGDDKSALKFAQEGSRLSETRDHRMSAWDILFATLVVDHSSRCGESHHALERIGDVLPTVPETDTNFIIGDIGEAISGLNEVMYVLRKLGIEADLEILKNLKAINKRFEEQSIDSLDESLRSLGLDSNGSIKDGLYEPSPEAYAEEETIDPALITRLD